MTCIICHGEVEHYDGALGYEAMVCKTCGAHHTFDGVWIRGEVRLTDEQAKKLEATREVHY